MGQNSTGETRVPGQLNLFTGEVETFLRGRDEMNLAEFPIAVVAEAAQPGQLTLRFSDSIRDQSSGDIVERSVTVHGTEEWGLPAAQDDEVMIGLLQLSFLSHWSKKIRFTRYQLCKLLRWSIGGASYKRIYQALHRLSTTNYNYRYAWRDKTNQQWIPSTVFSYIQTLKIHEADKPTDSGLCEVTWSDDFHRSLLAGNLKAIDFGLFVSLSRPVSKRLYRFLDKRFGLGKNTVTCDLKTLAFEKIGISRQYRDAAQIKRALIPAIKELVEAKYIAPASTRERFEKVSKGNWKVAFTRFTNRSAVELSTEQEISIFGRLVKHGVSKAVARTLADEKPEEFLKTQVEILEHNQAKGKGPENPGAWLATACRGKGFDPPSGYETPIRREAREKAEAERSREQASRTASEEKARARAREAAEATITDFLENRCPNSLLRQFQGQVSLSKAKFGLGDHYDEQSHLRFLVADYLFDKAEIAINPRDL